MLLYPFPNRNLAGAHSEYIAVHLNIDTIDLILTISCFCLANFSKSNLKTKNHAKQNIQTRLSRTVFMHHANKL